MGYCINLGGNFSFLVLHNNGLYLIIGGIVGLMKHDEQTLEQHLYVCI